ncbi:hypothetical protein [Nocardioides sp. YIM 152315]|uniref:hypothetical protein n=1 Tax=Nocardioides sp. YIM 152315 TaxID=3031760 RepID=UPI0023DC68BF|nr:hypothetical protein [Nocardioides sp. YIM 152315]MDF1603385.1 hypothetical protein [Nocardioides sp. YIM 152315]
MRVCIESGCGTLTDKTRCLEHRRAKDQARGTRQERGYDAEYDRLRAADVAAMARGEVLTCWRCERVVMPHDYSLGHCDDDRSIIHGPEHLHGCNLANTRGGCPHASHISPAA